MAKKITARKPSLDKLCRRGKAWAYSGDKKNWHRDAFVCRLPADGKNGGRFQKVKPAGRGMYWKK